MMQFYVKIFTNFSPSVFDPLGINKRKEKLLRKYVPKEFHIDYNTNQFQDINSENCGSYICYFCLNAYFNEDLPFNELLNLIFKSDPKTNEKKVEDFLKEWT